MKKDKNKKILIITIISIILIIAAGLGYNILFPKYYTLENNSSKIQCIEINSYNKRVNYIFDDKEEIEKIMDYICSIKYRKLNIYENIIEQFRGPVAHKTGYEVKLYSSKECKDTDLLKTVGLKQVSSIYIDEEKYVLEDDKLNASSGIRSVIEENINP